MSSGGSTQNYNTALGAGLQNQANAAFPTTPYPDTGGAATGAYGGAGQMGSNAAANQQTASQYAAQDAANYQNAQGVNSSLQEQGANAAATGSIQYGQLANYINPIMQQAFDPQQALFNQQFQQQQDQTQASNAMAGVAGTPYGAGITANANQNFDINWQNQQLQREATGATAAEGLSSTAMSDLTSGYNTQTADFTAGQNALTGASSAGATDAANLGSMSNNTLQQQIQDYLSYLSGSSGNSVNYTNASLGGINANTSLYGAQNTAQYNNQALTNQSLSGLGSLLGTGAGAYANYAGLSNIANAL